MYANNNLLKNSLFFTFTAFQYGRQLLPLAFRRDGYYFNGLS